MEHLYQCGPHGGSISVWSTWRIYINVVHIEHLYHCDLHGASISDLSALDTNFEIESTAAPQDKNHFSIIYVHNSIYMNAKQ